MKIALFAAVPEEVGTLADITTFTGIGRENATLSTLQFIEKHKGEKFTILNIGTVGSHDKEVGTILNIDEIISAGAPFNEERMLLAHLPISQPEIEQGTLYSSDCFVSSSVFTEPYLNKIVFEANCFDMESSAVFSIAHFYDIPFISYKIVSDNLDVDIEIWRERVHTLSKRLDAFTRDMIRQLAEKEHVEFLHN